MTNRRQFLAGIGAAGIAAALPEVAVAEPARQDFDFLFFTDTHLEPERDGVKGCAMAFRKMRGMKMDFAIQGGDHVYDSMECPPERARELFKLYDQTQQDLSVKVYHAIGNHDLFGLYPKSGVKPDDPSFGKRYFEQHIGKTYYSFDHKGVHFVVLDSVGITDDRAYEGRMDPGQIAWLAKDLEALPKGTPVIVTTHIPLVSAAESYAPPPAHPYPHQGLRVANAYEVLPVLEKHNVVAVLQGHHHINERVDWHGIPYITGGAVCGNWWQGTRMGTPEGFSVVSWRAGKVSVRYETYGFRTIDPHNT